MALQQQAIYRVSSPGPRPGLAPPFQVGLPLTLRAQGWKVGGNKQREEQMGQPGNTSHPLIFMASRKMGTGPPGSPADRGLPWWEHELPHCSVQGHSLVSCTLLRAACPGANLREQRRCSAGP